MGQKVTNVRIKRRQIIYEEVVRCFLDRDEGLTKSQVDLFQADLIYGSIILPFEVSFYG